MKNKILKWIFSHYKMQFYDYAVAEFFGDIPENLKEPSLEFLARSRNTLERFFSVQAYLLQRKSINDPKNARFYDGAMMISKAMLYAIRQEPLVKDSTGVIAEKKVEADPIEGVNDFAKGLKELNSK